MLQQKSTKFVLGSGPLHCDKKKKKKFLIGPELKALVDADLPN